MDVVDSVVALMPLEIQASYGCAQRRQKEKSYSGFFLTSIPNSRN